MTCRSSSTLWRWVTIRAMLAVSAMMMFFSMEQCLPLAVVSPHITGSGDFTRSLDRCTDWAFLEKRWARVICLHQTCFVFYN